MKQLIEQGHYVITATMTPTDYGLIPCITCKGKYNGKEETSYLYNINDLDDAQVALVIDHAFEQGEESVLIANYGNAYLMYAEEVEWAGMKVNKTQPLGNISYDVTTEDYTDINGIRFTFKQGE
jgi:hypothetical protein